MGIKELKIKLAASEAAQREAMLPFREEQRKIQAEIDALRAKRGYITAAQRDGYGNVDQYGQPIRFYGMN